MHFTNDDIDINDSLIEALAKDRLVVFVGAGVSGKAYPAQKESTYYPKFDELVSQIADRLEKTITDEEKKRCEQGFLDQILGEWKSQGYDVHSIASDILTKNENQQRISVHRAIIRLFPKGSSPRIVTTNFDNLLIRARDEEGLTTDQRWKRHVAPALPPGHRFTGICFLHGSVKDLSEMVLTDKDIGRVYMDEGWALKFAHRLFNAFDVLFIGYSLEDPPLRYLSLALEGTSKRQHWALIPKPKCTRQQDRIQRDWNRRGVKVIWFPCKRKDFRALERVIDALAKNNRLGYIDRRNRLYSWAGSDPSHLPPHELDRVKYFLSVPELVRDFASIDLNKNWFDQLLEWGHFDLLLKSSGDYSMENIKDADLALARRLTHWLMNNPMEWMTKLIKHRETMHPLLLDFFLEEFGKNEGDRIGIEDLRKLLEFFKVTLEKDTSKSHVPFAWSEKVLIRLIERGFITDAVWFFISIIKPYISVNKKLNIHYLSAKINGKGTSGIMQDTTEFKANFGNIYVEEEARTFIEHVRLRYIGEIGYPMIIALTQEFYDMRIAINRGGSDSATYIYRKSIEPQVEDNHGSGPAHFFIDTLRDLWEALLPSDPDRSLKIFQQWREIDDVFFRRLSLHAARKLLEETHD